VLREHWAVQQSAVVASEGERGENRLIGYVVGLEGMTTVELKKYARERLPEYMVPEAILILEEMPITANGKIDRKKLSMLKGATRQLEQEYLGPRTPVEEIVVGIFEEVLKMDRVGRNDNFFEIGGHSLLATRVISRVRNRFGVEIGVRSLFDEATAARLARRIEEAMRAGDMQKAPPLVRVSRKERLPLSFAQQRLWFIDQWDPGSPVYNIPGAIRLEGRLDLQALERVMNEIFRRHDVLRTKIKIEEGEPVQVVEQWEHQSLAIEDLTNLSPEVKEEESKRITRENAETRFDLSNGPLIRVKVLKLEEEQHVALFTMHHIVSDGWSMGILANEVGALYQAYSTGGESPFDELPIQYADFAVWQRQWLKGDVLEEQINYWKKQLDSAPELELPTSNGRQTSEMPKSASHAHIIPADVAKAVKSFREQKEATLFMVLLTAFTIAIHRFTGQRDLVIGTDIANRNRAEIESLIGFFVNELLLRIKLDGDPTFDELFTQVRETALNAYLYQDAPFDKLVEILKPERRNSHTPLIRAKLVVQNTAIKALALPALTIGGVGDIGKVEGGLKCDFLLTCFEQKQEIVAHVTYNEAIVQRSTTVALLRNIEKILKIALEDPTLRLNALMSKLEDIQRRQQKQKIAHSLKMIKNTDS
jgi:acyl carrier protein